MFVMHYKIFSGELEKIDFSKKGMVIDTINPHSYIVAKGDRAFKRALRHADVLLPDGWGIVWAIHELFHEKIHRIAGSDLHDFLLKKMQERKGRIFYLGASQETLEKIELRIHREYPEIEVKTFSPPYKSKFSKNENEAMIRVVNQFAPDILFVGMTAPKQEKWVEEHKHLVQAGMICSIGAVFDFFAGTVQRSGSFWITHHLEWLPRFLHEPKRLWRRIFIAIPNFLRDVYLFKLRIFR